MFEAIAKTGEENDSLVSWYTKLIIHYAGPFHDENLSLFRMVIAPPCPYLLAAIGTDSPRYYPESLLDFLLLDIILNGNF